MALAKFVDSVVARVRTTPVDAALLFGEREGSILSGAAGVALFLHEAARLSGDDSLCVLARQWCEVAREWAERSTARSWGHSPFGLVMGEGGIAYVEALLALRDGERSGVFAAIERIERAAARVGETAGGFRPTELFGGAAGIACAVRTLEGRLPAASEYDAARGVLKRVGEKATRLVLARYAGALDPGPDEALGFAHGIAGELWSLVTLVGAGHPVVRARLGELGAVRELDEDDLVYWLPRRGSEETDMLGTLCNGMPGHTLLWCEVARQTRDPAAIELATRCAESTDVLVTRMPTLCCGLAGQALALTRYAELSGDSGAAERAQARLLEAIERAWPAELPLLSLWQGLLGIALVCLETLHGKPTLPGLEPLAPRD
jgi:hypothetical protein